MKKRMLAAVLALVMLVSVLPQRDWALLETGWANAYTGNGGEVN